MPLDLPRLRSHLLSFPGAVEDFPWGPEFPTWKVRGRMFALLILDRDPPWLNLKCDPLHAEVLRTYYPAVRPAWHMSKQHWNTVVLDGSIPEDEVHSMAGDSYSLVVRGLPRADREVVDPEGSCRSKV